MGFTRQLTELVSRYTGITLLLVLSLTLISLTAIIDIHTGQLRLNIDPSANRLLSENLPAKQFYDHAREIFGSDETLVITLTAGDIFTRDVLDRIKRITTRIEEVGAVHHVVSLANAPDIRSVGDELDISPFMSGLEDGSATLEDIRRRVLGNRAYAGSLVSTDGEATALIVYFNDISDSDYIRGGIHEQIRNILEEERDGYRVFMSGTPYFKVAMVDLLLKDLLWTPPLITAILAVVLAIALRTFVGVFVPLVTVAVGVILTLGTIAGLGYSLSMISALVPPLLMILGLSYSVHVVTEYHQIRRDHAAGSSAIQRTLEHMTLPVLLTGLTTIAGFVALMANPISAVSEFGIFAVIGVIYTTLLSITFTPAMLSLLDRRSGKQESGRQSATDSVFNRFVEWIARFDLDYRRGIFIGFGIVFLLALAGMTNIRVSTESITNFAKGSDVRNGFEVANAKLGGANPFYIVISGDYSDSFKEPANLNLIKDLQDWLLEQPEIGGTVSLVDYVMLVHQAFNGNDPAFYTIPENKRLITQLLFLSSSEELERLVDSRYRTTSIVVRSKVINSERMSALIKRINRKLAEFPEHLTPVVTGNPVLIGETLTEIIVGQARSVGLALVFVYIILSIMFMSQRIGLVALLPNIIPIVVYFGSLGIFDISLNPSTSLIAPMVLGIAIDDTIHYFSRFNREVRRHADDRKATLLAMKSVGRPVTLTSVCLCLGFLVLLTSELRMQVQVGVMASYALAIAWLSDFLLTPALCASIRFTTLWDALTLDLGSNPQESIPLLNGLRPSQARIVALMAKIIRVPAGRRIITDGEQGSEMYVVIDGKLQSWVEGKEGRIDLASHVRGDVVGEAGLFYENRTANVDAAEDSRLLCIEQSNLDRLSRRYPYIANKVFRNLNKVLATRLFRTTHRLT
jgi:predicted RND superfamily exporter protein